MATTITINHLTKVILVPVNDSCMTAITPGIGGVYAMDVNVFRKNLKDLEDDPEGMTLLDTHTHNTEIVLSGVTYSRFFEIINGYTVEFDESVFDHYIVVCSGANHNIADVKVLNTISLIIGNSAGLVTVSATLTQQQMRDAMTLTTTGGKKSVDDKLDDNKKIGLAGL
jgi:hypothetical protein